MQGRRAGLGCLELAAVQGRRVGSGAGRAVQGRPHGRAVRGGRYRVDRSGGRYRVDRTWEGGTG